MMNYKITFNLDSPISFQDVIMFDGLVAYAYAQESKLCNNGKLNFNKNELVDFTNMPINIHKDGYYMASWMFYENKSIVEHIAHWKKRWCNMNDDLADFGKNKRKIRINNGSFKSYNMPLRVVDLDRCWFFFQSDNVKEVERLISEHIVGIGKKISQGFGIISSFEISKTNGNPFDKTIRPIPVNEPSTDVRWMGFKPPYWMPENQTFCKIK